MRVWSVLTEKPKPALSRRQRLVSLAGLGTLTVLLVAHSVALSVFLWQSGAGAKAILLLAFSWAVSLFGLWLNFRFVKTVCHMPSTAPA